MTSEGLGEMFEGDSADTCGGKFPLTSMGDLMLVMGKIYGKILTNFVMRKNFRNEHLSHC